MPSGINFNSECSICVSYLTATRKRESAYRTANRREQATDAFKDESYPGAQTSGRLQKKLFRNIQTAAAPGVGVDAAAPKPTADTRTQIRGWTYLLVSAGPSQTCSRGAEATLEQKRISLDDGRRRTRYSTPEQR